MLNIKQNNNKTYNEVGQVNPLRWKILLRSEDGSCFVDQSGWIKCKDFFNDSVAFFKEGTKFSIYGYQNTIEKNKEGVYMLLKFVKDKSSFFKNLDVVNQRLKSDLGCVISVEDHVDDECVVLLPNEVWESTYRISMITMVIRLCNYGNTYKSWEEIWGNNPALKVDQAFTPDAIKNAATLGFLVLPKFSKYWYYCGDKYNSETSPKQTGSTIHNNGVSNWSMYMKGLA